MFKKAVFFAFINVVFIALYAGGFAGVHGGFNIATTRMESGPTPDPLLGISCGLYADKDFNPNTSMFFAVNYSQKGHSEEYSDGRLYKRLHYLSIPVQLRLSPKEMSLGKLYFGAGFSANFCLAGRYYAELDNGGDYSGDLEDLAGFELSSIFSVGMYVKKTIKLEVTYDLGLTDINKADDENAIEVKTNTIMLIAGVVTTTVF